MLLVIGHQDSQNLPGTAAGLALAGLPGAAVAAGEPREDSVGLSGWGGLFSSGVPVGVGGSCKGVAPGLTGASEAEFLGGRPGVDGDCETGAGVAAGDPALGLLGALPGAGELLLPTVVGEGTRLLAGVVEPGLELGLGLGLGLGLVIPVAGDAVGSAGGVALVPVNKDGVGTGDALVPVDGDAGEPAG